MRPHSPSLTPRGTDRALLSPVNRAHSCGHRVGKCIKQTHSAFAQLLVHHLCSLRNLSYLAIVMQEKMPQASLLEV